MIIEMRSYRLKPGSVAEVEKRFGEALRDRVKVSPLGAFFHTEVGPLNRIIHCWPYENLGERTRLRGEAMKLPGYLADMARLPPVGMAEACGWQGFADSAIDRTSQRRRLSVLYRDGAYRRSSSVFD